jgi:hypothetical protein
MLWGGGFFFATVLFLSGAFIQSRHLARQLGSIPDALNVHFAEERISGPEEFRMEIRSALRPLPLPGIISSYEISFRNRAGVSISSTSFLPAAGVSAAVPCPGRYRPVKSAVFVGDVLGFTRIELATGKPDGFLRLPDFHESPAPFPAREGGETRRVKTTVRRSDEFLDSRKYVIGDDPRKTNWKQYGHLGELFIRQGEYFPPPVAFVRVVLNTELPPGILSERDRLPYFYALVGACAGYVDRLLRHGYAGSLVVPGLPARPLDEVDTAAFLADAAPDDGSLALAPSDSDESTVLLTAPGTSRFTALSASLAVACFLARDGKSDGRQSLFRSLLFSGAPASGSRERRCAARFDSALAGDLAAFQPTGGRHALVIR